MGGWGGGVRMGCRGSSAGSLRLPICYTDCSIASILKQPRSSKSHCRHCSVSYFIMGERKVLNKYYPPDFDPTLIPRNRKPKDRKYTVNLMMPMTIQCSACGQFMYMGKKVNGMKEMVNGESYLGIAIHRCVGVTVAFIRDLPY